jgi:hypothetical protein
LISKMQTSLVMKTLWSCPREPHYKGSRRAGGHEYDC